MCTTQLTEKVEGELLAPENPDPTAEVYGKSNRKVIDPSRWGLNRRANYPPLGKMCKC